LGVLILLTLSCNLPWGQSYVANEQTAVAQTVLVQLTASSGKPVPSNTPTLTPIPCNAAKFAAPISFPDDAEVLINTEFVKTWRL
jgi:hypothetical protein